MKAKKKKAKCLNWHAETLTETIEPSYPYAFYNKITGVVLYVQAESGDDAMRKFDLCHFPAEHRKDWKVLVEIGSQPDFTGEQPWEDTVDQLSYN